VNFFTTLLIDALLSLPLITVYLLYAIGIVVIYRASRVLNLAHGVMAMIPAYVFYSLAAAGVPLLLAVALGVVFGAALGVATERLVVSRLRRQGPTAQTVGTIAVFGLGVAMVAKIYGTAPLITKQLFPSGSVSVGYTGLSYGNIIVFVISLLVAGAAFALFRFTGIGLAMRGAADNRRGAQLMGIDVDRTTMVAWAIGGGMAGLAGIFVGALGNIDPYTLSAQVLPAFVAALLGGMESLPGAVWGAGIVGLVQGEVPAFGLLPVVGPFAESVGFSQLVLMVVTFVVMILRGTRLVGSRVRDEALGAVAAVVTRTRSGPSRPQPLAIAAAIFVAVFPFLPFIPFSVVGDGVLAAFYLVVALSVVLLTGWVGQISLAQAEFVGVSAFFTAVLSNQFGIGMPFSFFLATAMGGLIAAALGIVSLRVRGLYLAVATLVFAAMADSFLFNASWFGNGSAVVQANAIGNPGALPYFDFSSIRLIYLMFIALAGFSLYALANLRESKTGRAFFAVRGSEVAAASLGINVIRYKLLAFLLSGMLAGAAGNLYAVYFRSIVNDSFTVLVSLFILSIAVVGGLFSLGGAVCAAILFAALQELFFRVSALSGFLDIVSSVLLLAVLLLYPGGLAAIPDQVRQLVERRARRPGWMRAPARVLGPLRVVVGRLPRPPLVKPHPFRRTGAGATPSPRPVHSSATRDSLAALTARAGEARPGRQGNGSAGNGVVAGRPAALAMVAGEGDPALPVPAAATRSPWEGFSPARRCAVDEPRPDDVVLAARDVTVRFGGLVAVNGVNLDVRRGEIVGLIGANGAGKTTLFNTISGLQQPTAGSVELFGSEVSHLDVHQRAALGIARTFQDIQLFPQLTVFDNLLVATHLRNKSHLGQHVVVSVGAVLAERDVRTRVRTVLEFLELTELGPRPIRDLSFGQLRMIEIARGLVTGAELILLDEPASGLDNTESDRLVELLLYVREELNVTMLVVEHDVNAVVRLSDYMFVVDQGSLISQGRPQTVQQDQAVKDAYLGKARPAAEPAGVAS
jgi:sulfate-transporting ATPase